ncbi:MAG TPA: DUF4190 domain-containing protein [Anaerohalosphaeraceae bacterium]|nr:DUF4190 domain-containing protein [Anaerohalosphaeraceae bacterium]HOM76898.1 DUF4190 domain-containing protein [Anaerohalosphaeraceae bacterium]HPC64746.1 DUF4190 domain-containing protein [Anaerohalosphaeraceae bacterium]HPO70883.1 DUF4190 domain-containing protein [Anaerohalosphaeraceae bacterium]HRS72567.1 DUF4190 domain-containing protein [Anaerohalosphaeraceae bacterium]
MYCTKCGIQNSDGAVYCVNCGTCLMGTPGQGQQAAVQPRISRLAIASLVMGLLCMTCVLCPILAFPAILCGIIALIKISGQRGVLKGTGMAITGIVIPLVMVLFIPFFIGLLTPILLPALHKTQSIAQRTMCSSNLKALAAAMIFYAYSHEDVLPGENWCDLLIEQANVSPQAFVCPASDAVIGESSYAMNNYIAGRKSHSLPPDMVMLFETSKGFESGVQSESGKIRRQTGLLHYDQDGRLRKERFNQMGGPEDLLLRHDEGAASGCNVAFVDGHVEFVRQDRISKLKWTAQ